MLTIITNKNDLDLLCAAVEKSSIQENKKIETFDFSGYLTDATQTVDFDAFVKDCYLCITEAIKKL